jgi:tetratricopeptide (TPR) repeat protein
MPSMRASWDIAMQTLHEHPLLGSGPGTFILDYAKYRSPDVYLSQFWNIRFDRGASHVLTSFASTGYLGTLSWLILALYLLGISVRSLLQADEKTWHIMVSIFSAWLLLVLGRFLYSSTITLEFVFWMTTAFLVIVLHKDWYAAKFDSSPRAAMALSFLFILAIVFSLSGLFAQGQRYASEVHYARAIENDHAGGKSDDTLASFAAATSLNRNNDVIIRNGALALLGKTNELLNTPVDIKKDDGESDVSFKARQEAATGGRIREASDTAVNAVNVAKSATEIGPADVANWSVLASVYQNLMGITDGADAWAVTTFEKAIELEPANPALYTELGKVYLWQADRQSEIASAKDAKKEDADAAKAKGDELIQKAVDTFTKATDLKRDYAPAYYHQGLAYERQGKAADAISRLEAVVTLSPQDVGVGFQLALLYYQNDRKDDAIRLMESVVRISPKYSNALWYLGAMYEDKGDFEKASEMISRVAELNPDNALVTQKLAELSGKAAQPPKEGEEGLPPPVDQQIGNPNEPGM